MNWDGFQREALAALGHKLYVRADAAPGADAGAADAAVPAAGSASVLSQALARAAGCATQELPALELEPLRRSAAAKRALWPSLRRLRASAS